MQLVSTVEDRPIAATEPQEQTGSMSTNGTFYTYWEGGEASELVVCVHGIGSYSGQYVGMANMLYRKGYSVLSYDLLGRGDSAYPDDNSFDGDAHVKQLRDLLSFLQLTGKRRYHIISHSMGGAIATQYAAAYLEEVASVVLLCPAGLMDLGPLRLLRGCFGYCLRGIVKRIIKRTQEDAWRKGFASHKGESLEIEEAFVAEMKEVNKRNPRHYDAFWESAMQYPLSGIDLSVEALSNSKHTSVLLMWGLLDSAVPFNPNFSRWKRLLDTNKETRDDKKLVSFITYDDMDHAFPLEIEKRVTDSIDEFFADIKRRSM